MHACPLFQFADDLIHLKIHHILPEVHHIICSIPERLRQIVNMSMSHKKAHILQSEVRVHQAIECQLMIIRVNVWLTTLKIYSNVNCTLRDAAAFVAWTPVFLRVRYSVRACSNSSFSSWVMSWYLASALANSWICWRESFSPQAWPAMCEYGAARQRSEVYLHSPRAPCHEWWHWPIACCMDSDNIYNHQVEVWGWGWEGLYRSAECGQSQLHPCELSINQWVVMKARE